MFWSERQLVGGTNQKEQMLAHLDQDNYVVFLLSADFFACEICLTLMHEGLLRQQQGRIAVIPLLVRPVAWQDTPLGAFACLPTNGIPIMSWEFPDEGWHRAAQELRRLGSATSSTASTASVTSFPSERPRSSTYQISIDLAPIIGDNLHFEQHIHVPLISTLTPEQKRNRERLLAKVRAFWIDGVLKQSLHGQELIALGLSQQRNLLENAWRPVLSVLHQPEQQLQAGTLITEVYDNALGELLILGEPGSGKTTLLLDLARNLLERAQADENQPMPLIFNLSSWATERQALDRWLVKEMVVRYQIPYLLAQSWMASERIIPLLDGLDEVVQEARHGCVQAINAYHAQHGLQSLVICSRKADYESLPAPVELGTTVTILPLTLAQINGYLSKAEGRLDIVKAALYQDQILRELAQIPLMLDILVTVSVETSAPDLFGKGSLEARREAIFDTYISHALKRRSPALHYYPLPQTTRWLGWLAWQMKRHNMSVFYIEELQVDWLARSWSRLTYHTVLGCIFGLVASLIGGLMIGLVLGLFFGLATSLIATLMRVLILGSALGLVGGFIVGCRGGSDSSIQLTEGITWSYKSFLHGLKEGLQRGLWAGLVVGLVTGSIVGIIIGLIFGPVAGLLVGFVSVLFLGGVVALSTGLKGESGPLPQPTLRNRVFSGLNGGLIAGLRRGLIGGLQSKTLDTSTRNTPNQGIWRSATYAGITALIFGGFFGVLGMLTAIGIMGLGRGLSVGGIVGLSAALSAGLIFGGEACTKHVLLRFLLWQTGVAPRSYSRFLDYAAERILLRKVGGGYIFIHRSLLEHFAFHSEEEL
ncbi:MAG TPA: NACHT domain-containing protein [Ktedonosporobacter sp.]|nr:NACHT domain-containing protein [Ktedonosporobacter sp.]